jgi:hypothetical protein
VEIKLNTLERQIYSDSAVRSNKVIKCPETLGYAERNTLKDASSK